ncbi:hypothetical protein D3C86_1458630 [compost metagenome]
MLVPLKIISLISVNPSFFNRLNSAINTIPLSTATPNNAINPTPAEILNGISRNHNANTPPIAESGMAVKISRLCFIDLNVKNNSNKISNKATGTAILNRKRASSRFLNVPP